MEDTASIPVQITTVFINPTRNILLGRVFLRENLDK